VCRWVDTDEDARARALAAAARIAAAAGTSRPVSDGAAVHAGEQRVQSRARSNTAAGVPSQRLHPLVGRPGRSRAWAGVGEQAERRPRATCSAGALDQRTFRIQIRLTVERCAPAGTCPAQSYRQRRLPQRARTEAGRPNVSGPSLNEAE